MNGRERSSWGHVADWYDEHLSERDTYHAKVVFPNLLRIMDVSKGETVLDIPAGQGAFSKLLAAEGASVIAVDIAKELIAIAERDRNPNIRYFVSPSHRLDMIPNESIDKCAMVLGIQNIKDVAGTMKELSRVMRPRGEFYVVMNHPAFRVPKESSWGWEKEHGKQYRRIDAYLSEGQVSIDMKPGSKEKERAETVSYHRPLQWYFKILGKHNFAVDRLEEWISHKESTSGPRAKEENRIRKEIPLFLMMRAIRLP
jgi:ubiquinone/menaquinone biosynthesis C-methylase UbiE